jgi:Xaa-Pro dipeptidase
MVQDARIEAVRIVMRAEGIDLLIALSSGVHAIDRPNAVAHLSGYRSVGESAFLLGRDDALLIVSPAWDSDRAAAHCTRAQAEAIAADDLPAAIEATLRNRRIAPPNIATVGIDTLPYRLAEGVLVAIGSEAKTFDHTLYSVEQRKTDAEIDRARQATIIAEKGFERLLEIARVGMRECDLAVDLNCHTKSLGAEDNFLMLSASPHALAVMPSSARKLERGDILLIELSPNFNGQFSQICRTVCVGPPPRTLQQKYDLVLRAMWAGIESVRPGIPVSQVCRAIDGVLEARGYAEYCRPPHMRRRGHGLGCSSVAPGDISIDNETILEEGMLFVVHPNQYVPETGYLLCGEPVRVTSSGAELLSSRTAALAVVGSNQKGTGPCD